VKQPVTVIDVSILRSLMELTCCDVGVSILRDILWSPAMLGGRMVLWFNKLR
jgi:hypothetical protein